MSDFTSITLGINTGTLGSPVYTTAPASGTGTGKEVRWSDQSNQGATASASWPNMTRPGSTAAVPYLYVFTADTTSLGYLGTSSSTPIAYANSNYLMARWSWDAVGTFAGAPTFTAYNSASHDTPTRGDGTILGGSTTDTGATARSYLKMNLYGSGATTQTPAAAPTNAPVVTDGATGVLTPGASAWLTNYQGLQGDNDFIMYGSTPTATTAQAVFGEYALFTGPGMSTGIYTPVLSIKYLFV